MTRNRCVRVGGKLATARSHECHPAISIIFGGATVDRGGAGRFPLAVYGLIIISINLMTPYILKPMVRRLTRKGWNGLHAFHSANLPPLTGYPKVDSQLFGLNEVPIVREAR